MSRRVVAGRTALGVVTVLTSLLTVACTVGPSSRPAIVVAGNQPRSSASSAPVRPKPLPPLDKPQFSQVDWADCGSQTRLRMSALGLSSAMNVQCARVVGPLNSPSAPGQGIARISLLKVGTGATPLLVINDLDGLPGTLYAAQLASQLPAQLLQTFSLVGVDRRGTGSSDGVHCVPQNDRSRIVGDDPNSEDLTDPLAATQDASQQCVLDLDIRVSALDTAHTVDDLEMIRQQLGVRHLDAIGHGEGSRVLTSYADRYPAQVGRLVLDGSPDPTLDSTDAAQARANAAEATFAAFAIDCVNRGCPLGSNPLGTLTQLLGQLRGQPLTLPDNTKLSSGSALRAVLLGLSDRAQWPALAQAIAAAHGGDGGALEAFVRPVVLGTPYDPPWLDASLASGCNDEPDRLSPAQVADTVRKWATSQPLFGGLFAQDLLRCAPWPVASQPPAKPNAPGVPPILVLSTATDPVTPETGTQRTAQALSSGVLVSWAGVGHGALVRSTCATAAAQHFLVDGQVPQNPTACPP